MSTEPSAWVGCLACYNAGQLRGEWFEGEDVPTDHAEWLAVSERACSIVGHEELWIFDHEGYGPTLAGECSPEEAQAAAETLAKLEDNERPAFFAYMSMLGTDSNTLAEHVEDFREAYCGEWSSLAEFAAELASEIGAVPSDMEWPLRHIDWEEAARELEMGGDFFVVGHPITETYRGMPVGGVYVFRGNI